MNLAHRTPPAESFSGHRHADWSWPVRRFDDWEKRRLEARRACGFLGDRSLVDSDVSERQCRPAGDQDIFPASRKP